MQRIIEFEARRINNELELLRSLSVRSNAEGYLVVATPRVDFDPDESIISSAARLLRLTDCDLKRVFTINAAAPVARLPSIHDADRLRQELKALELESVTVPESVLQSNRESRQIRALILTNDSLTGIATQKDTVSTSWDKVRLIVQGRLWSHRIETEESKSGRRTRLIDKRERSSDESVLDIYIATDEVNWRILGSNFDFSCVGPAKRATAFENFILLVQLLRDRVTAQFDDAYIQSRQLLNVVWPLEQRIMKEHGRRNHLRKSRVATITTMNNELQFTRYSRLRHYLIYQKLPAAG